MKETTRKFFGLFLVITGALLVAACAKPPLEDMQKAADAVTAAENDSNAVTYASTALVSAREALTAMRDEATLKHYDLVKSHAAEAIRAADRAMAEGQAGALRARELAAAQIAAQTPAIMEASGLVSAVGQAADNTAALARGMEAAEKAAAQARESFNNNNFADALEKSQAASAAISDVSAKASEAVRAASRKK